VLAGFARQFKSVSLTKAGYHIGLTSFLLLIGAGTVHDASALNETRTLSFHHTHSDEDLTVTFKRDGRYDEAALKQLNHYLRDWRTQEETTMDRQLFDILWEVYRDVDGKKPIQIISSYRSPATNAMLRRRSSGVARFSQHMLGHAMDFYIPDVPLEQIRFAGLRLQRGGVGFYPTSGSPFVHLDTGSIRHWPRMTHDQLARVFPDGRTVHVPSDGKPLKGYELALADVEKRSTPDNSSAGSIRNLLAALFRSRSKSMDDAVGSNEEDDEVSATPGVANKTVASAKAAEPVPMPRAKPRFPATLQLAAADTQIVRSAKAAAAGKTFASSVEGKPQTPVEIINARGWWGDAERAQPTPADIAALNARKALISPESTASVSGASEALAYAPKANSAVDRAKAVAAGAPVSRTVGSAPASRNPDAATTIDTAGGMAPEQSEGNVVMASTRVAASRNDDVWMRMMILAPSATTSMHATVLGNPDMTAMRAHFVKPQSALSMSFSSDPQMGIVSDRFTGPATAKLPMQAL
jgi:uncharacterized protein YcbK (DUF882 family)